MDIINDASSLFIYAWEHLRSSSGTDEYFRKSRIIYRLGTHICIYYFTSNICDVCIYVYIYFIYKYTFGQCDDDDSVRDIRDGNLIWAGAAAQ